MKTSQPFLVVALYDKEGYYSSVIAETREEILKAVDVRSSKVKQLVACSVPFDGCWTNDVVQLSLPFPTQTGTHLDLGGGIPNVTLPPEWKKALASLDKKRED